MYEGDKRAKRVAMSADSTWIVEAQVVLRSPSAATEESRRDFFTAMRSITDALGSTPEVGWRGDSVAFVAIAATAPTEWDAASAVERIILERATSDPRLRVFAGLEVDVLSVRPVHPHDEAS